MHDELQYDWEDIILAKLAVPELPASHIRRPYLYSQFHKGLLRKVIVISAPAGFGKSTLLKEWHKTLSDQEERFFPLWLALGVKDSQGIRFWSHLTLLLKKAFPQTDDHSVAYPPAPANHNESEINRYKIRLSNFLHQVSSDTDMEYVLFLDNGDTVSEEFFAEIIDYSIAYLPPNFHVVIARAILPSALHDYRYNGSIFKFPSSDLAFSRKELMSFMAARYGNAASEQLTQNLYNLTQGWITGVRLFTDAVETHSIRFKNSVSTVLLHSLADEYFSSTIEEQTGNDLSHFLICTSLLERMNHSLCDFLLNRDDSAVILSDLVSHTFFIRPCQGRSGWFEYHPLFLHWLRTQLFKMEIPRIRELASRAQDWLELNDEPNEAAKYMLMGSEADLIDSLAEAAGCRRRDTSISFIWWVCDQRASSFSSDTTLSLYVTWGYICFGRGSDALKWLQIFQGNLGSAESPDGDIVSKDSQAVKLTIEHIKIKCREFEGHYKECITEYKSLLSSQDTVNPSLRAVVAHAIAESYERIGEYDLALDYYLQTEAVADLSKSVFFVTFSRYAVSWILALRGELHNAQATCQHALDDCPTDFTLYGAVQALTAHIHIEKNDLATAKSYLRQAMTRLSCNRNADMLYEAQVIEACYIAASGELDDAYRQIVGTVLSIENRGLPRAILLLAYTVQARLALVRENIIDAEAVYKKLTLNVGSSDVFYILQMKFIEAFLLYSEGDEHALTLIEEVIHKAKKVDLNTITLDALLLKAVILESVGKRSEALQVMNKSIQLGSKLDLIRPFLGNGRLLHNLLIELVNVRKTNGTKLKFLNSIKKALKVRDVTDESEGISSVGENGLTKRETEVLDLLNIGMSRKEIADALGVSYNTVKTHLNNIYSKLGVKNRSEAFKLSQNCDAMN